MLAVHFLAYLVILCCISAEDEKPPIVQCTSTKGKFDIEIYRDWSPLGAQRFLELVVDGFLTDIGLFRCVKGFLTQFGISDKPQYKHWHNDNIKDDPNLQKGIKKHYLSYAGGGPDTRSTQLFIAFEDLNFLGKEPWETPFGKVVWGSKSIDTWNTEYGDMKGMNDKGKQYGVDQSRVYSEGNTYLKQDFPNLDYILECKLYWKDKMITTLPQLAEMTHLSDTAQKLLNDRIKKVDNTAESHNTIKSKTNFEEKSEAAVPNHYTDNNMNNNNNNNEKTALIEEAIHEEVKDITKSSSVEKIIQNDEMNKVLSTGLEKVKMATDAVSELVKSIPRESIQESMVKELVKDIVEEKNAEAEFMKEKAKQMHEHEHEQHHDSNNIRNSDLSDSSSSSSNKNNIDHNDVVENQYRHVRLPDINSETDRIRDELMNKFNKVRDRDEPLMDPLGRFKHPDRVFRRDNRNDHLSSSDRRGSGGEEENLSENLSEEFKIAQDKMKNFVEDAEKRLENQKLEQMTIFEKQRQRSIDTLKNIQTERQYKHIKKQEQQQKQQEEEAEEEDVNEQEEEEEEEKEKNNNKYAVGNNVFNNLRGSGSSLYKTVIRSIPRDGSSSSEGGTGMSLFSPFVNNLFLFLFIFSLISCCLLYACSRYRRRFNTKQSKNY